MWKTQEKHPSLTARGIRGDSPGKLILGLNLKDERVGLNTDAKSLKAKEYIASEKVPVWPA